MAEVIAAIDCGTNTIKLLIGALPQVFVRESRHVRLGQGVDTSGELAAEALDRAFAAIDEYAALISRYPVVRIRFCATSATRDAANGAVFAAGVHERLGVWPEVIDGMAEARLSFDGAWRNLREPHPEPVLVLDIGGGSTELILGGEGGPKSAYSMNVGSVRMTERHLHSDPPDIKEVRECIADIDAHLDRARDEGGIDLSSARSAIGVAGTMITVAAGVLGLPSLDRSLTNQADIAVPAIYEYVDWLAATTLPQRLALPYMTAGRADVIIGGGLILDRVLRRTSLQTITASEDDILEGIAWSIAG